MKIEEQILGDLKSLINQYEEELTFLHDRSMNKFDMTQLPQVIQDMVRVANAKTPSFSNISAVAVSNFVLSHLFGQLRPTINDNIYSDDNIGINTYSIIISRSGCVDADTEFCTPNGWKHISDFTVGDKVLSWNEDGSSEFVLPIGYIKGPNLGFIHFTTDKVDMLLSPDHNVALWDNLHKVYTQCIAKELVTLINTGNSRYTIPSKDIKDISYQNVPVSTLEYHYTAPKEFQYCFTMPNSNWVARRNNKIFLTKNSGKDSTYQALSKAASKAHEFINKQHLLELEDKARMKFIRDAKKTTPDLDESTITRDMYEHFISKPETSIASLGSTRGGITTSLNRMAKNTFGVKSLFASELGLAIQSNSSIVEVLELFSTLYDMGESVSPEFKTQESKEESVSGMFPNLLGISSPAPFYTEGNVSKLFVPMLTTSLARRVSIIFSNANEEFENEYIPKSPLERREIQAQNRVVLTEYTERLNEHFLKCVKHTLADPIIMFDDEAQAIYDDYKSYTQDLSKYLLLKDGDSVEGIEMSGRAFKMGRIAATWTLAQNKRIIDVETLKAAIYFCDYTAQHLTRFAHTLELKDYEIFINDWEQGFIDNTLPVDQAITKGYISTKHLNKVSLENFLKPVNSRLEGVATVSYNDKTNAFVFVPVVKVVNGDYSYRAVPGHVKERPLTNIAANKPMEALGKLLSVDSTFNPFVEDSANFVVLNVEHSFLSLDMISKYLSKTHHYIGTSASNENKHAFTLVVPINSVIKVSEYKYVALSIANQLMLKIAPEHCEHDMLYHGYLGAVVLETINTTELFDISGILGNLASGADVPLLSVKPDKKPNTALITKYLQDDILQHKQLLIDMLDASSNPLLLFASIIYDLKVHYITDDRILEFIDNINSSLIKSIDKQTKEDYLIEPFINL